MKQTFDILTICITATLAITTIVYAWITSRMLNETRKMRESQTEPHVFINVQPMERAKFILNMVIQNIGPGPAYNLRFKIEPDIVLRSNHKLSEINLMKQGFRYLAPNQKVECIVAHTIEEASKKERTLHNVTVYYEDKDKKHFEETFVMDFTEYFGLLYSDSDPFKGIIEKLDTIHKDLDSVTRDSGSKIKVVAWTKEEQEEYVRRQLEENEEVAKQLKGQK
jgi:hypothetical protein